MSLLSLFMGDGGFDPSDLLQSYAEDTYNTPNFWDAISPWVDTAQNTANAFQDSVSYPQTMFTPQGNNYAEQYGLTYDEPGSSVASVSGASSSPWDTFSAGLQKAGDFASSKGGQLAIGGLGAFVSYLDAKKKNALMKQLMEQAAAEKAARAAKAAMYDSATPATLARTPQAWGAGTSAFANNGLARNATSNTMFKATGGHIAGDAPGQSDKVPAMLSDGEFVFDADTVSALGDGNNAAGASVLEKMRQNIRAHKRAAPVNKIPPKAKKPGAYLKGAK